MIRRRPGVKLQKAPPESLAIWPLFLRECGRYPLLDREETRQLLAQAQAGDIRARDKLCLHNMRFVAKVAMKHRGASLSFSDLAQEGLQGLLTAIQKYTLTHKVSFMTYAVWWIRQAMYRAMDLHGRTIRVPANHERDIKKLRKYAPKQVIGGGYVEDIETAKENGDVRNPPNILEIGIAATGTCAYNPHEDWSLQSEEPGPEQGLEDQEHLRQIKHLLSKLTRKEREIFLLRYPLDDRDGMTLEEVGQRCGVSRERIRQIEEKAKKKMRLAAAVLKAVQGKRVTRNGRLA